MGIKVNSSFMAAVQGGHLAVYIAVKVILSLHGDTFITSFVGNGPDDWSPEA